MSGGPRVTTGTDSKQDYATPDELIRPVNERFGPVVFDLAAHTGNKKASKYFAPREVTYTLESFDQDDLDLAIAKLARMGASKQDADSAVVSAWTRWRDSGKKEKKLIVNAKNSDPLAFGYDALDEIWNWATVCRDASSSDRLGLLWLNCEFNDVATWAARCKTEGDRGARIALLTPAMVGSNWFRDLIAPSADVYYLNGRVTFDGKNPYPKDCMISIYGPGTVGLTALWDWRRNAMLRTWLPAEPRAVAA